MSIGENNQLSSMVQGDSNITRDESLEITEISALLNDAVEKTNEVEVKKETALEKAKRIKEEQGSGMPITKEQYVADGEMKKEKLQVEQDFEKTVTDMDSKIEAAKQLNIPKPKTQEELVAAMNLLDSVANGEEIDAAVVAQLNITRKEEGQDKNVNYAAGMTPKAQIEQQEIPEDMQSNDSFDREDIVQILIDKTGMGGEVNLTPEEQEKVIRAKKIIVTEVENQTLSTIKFKPPTKSFTEMIAQHSIETTMTKVTFAASRFSGSMGGLGFGELADIALSRENITHDKLNKKLTIIYNNLKNTSVGTFDNYDEFLSKLAYTDIDFGTFALACSTFPEIDTITLNCNHPTCQHPFEHKYAPRTLIRFEKMRNAILRDMESINKCNSLEQSKELFSHGPVSEYKMIELPFSKYYIEIGIASAKEYLDDLMGVLLDETWNEKHPNDVNNILQFNSSFLTIIRAVSVPMGDEYVRFTDVNDIIEALYTIKPDEANILTEILNKYIATYTPVFGLVNVRCPHCQTLTKFLPIDINQLVFLKFQTWKNTTVELKGILDL